MPVHINTFIYHDSQNEKLHIDFYNMRAHFIVQRSAVCSSHMDKHVLNMSVTYYMMCLWSQFRALLPSKAVTKAVKSQNESESYDRNRSHMLFFVLQISAWTIPMRSRSSPTWWRIITTSPRWKLWRWRANVSERSENRFIYLPNNPSEFQRESEQIYW